MVWIVLFVVAGAFATYWFGYRLGVNFGDKRGFERCEATMRLRHVQELVDEIKKAHDRGFCKGCEQGYEKGVNDGSSSGYHKGFKAGEESAAATVADLRRRLARPKPIGVKRATAPKNPLAVTDLKPQARKRKAKL